MKKLCFVVLCCVTAFGVYAKGKTEAAPGRDEYVLKIASSISTFLCAAPMFIAEEKGFYKEEGLKYETVKIDSSQTPQLLTMGTIDVTMDLITAMIQPIVNGLDIKVPLTVHTGCIKVLVNPSSDIQTPADLKGKRIGTFGMGATTTIIVQRYLAELGIGTIEPNNEVEWLIFGGAELGLALERDQADAIILTDPAALIIENSGKGRAIINTTTDPQMKDEFCCVLVASSKAAAEHPQELAKMTRAIQKAAKWVSENPAEAARLMDEKKFAPGDVAVNAAAIASYNWDASVSAAKTSLLRNFTDLRNLGLIPQSVNAEALTNNIYLPLPGVPDKL